MRYRSFGDYARGYSHVKNGTECEDYACSYSDPEGRYHICTACDGHSDKNCFRSSRGARFGCESAVEILKRFFELYLDQEESERKLSKAMEERLKRGIKRSWEKKVQEDVREYPLTGEELSPLTDRVRKIYESGQGLSNIYGATFLAAAVCDDFFLVLHIGDGLLLCVDPDGTYYDPLPEDPKSDTGSPASLCDTDLFTRKEAFQSLMTRKLPQAVIVSSDGIGDCMDELQSREFVWDLFMNFEKWEISGNSGEQGLNPPQSDFLKSCLTYWAAQGNGVEDDCSLAGIYDLDAGIPKVRLPVEEVRKRWDETIAERDQMIKDYEKRKKETLQNIDQRMHEAARLGPEQFDVWIKTKEKIEEMKQILQNIHKNETEKAVYFEKKLEVCREYFRRAGNGGQPDIPAVKIQEIEEAYLKEDALFAEVKEAQKLLGEKKAAEMEAMRKWEEAKKAKEEAYSRWSRARREPELSECEEELHRTKEQFLKAEEEVRAAKKIFYQADTIFRETFSRARKGEKEPRKYNHVFFA